MAMPSKISAEGATFIGGEEGDIGYVYDDAIFPTKKYKRGDKIQGNLTAGIGHLLSRGNNIFPEAYEWIGKQIPHEQRALWFDNDNDVAETAVKTHVKAKLTQRQFDTLVSFVFNVGAADFYTSTLLKRLNRGDDWAKVISEELPKWRKTTINGKKITSQGLVKRRAHEIAFGLGGAVPTANNDNHKTVPSGTQEADAAGKGVSPMEIVGAAGTVLTGAAGFSQSEGWIAVGIGVAIVVVVIIGAAVVIKRVWFPH